MIAIRHSWCSAGAAYLPNFGTDSLLASGGGEGSVGVVLRRANDSNDDATVATNGDVSGEDIDDVLIGARDFECDRGAANVMYGRATPVLEHTLQGKRRRRQRAD